MVAHSRGGACQENAIAAYFYCRQHAAPAEHIRLVAVRGTDHAFVIIGSPWEADSELVVADPWPTNATAVLWEDHFMYTPNRGDVQVRRQMEADGQDVVSYYAGLIRMNSIGEYVARWDLNQLRGYSTVDLARMLERNGYPIDFNGIVTQQVLLRLTDLSNVDTSGVQQWSQEVLWLWCLSMVKHQIIVQMLRQNDEGVQATEQAVLDGLGQNRAIWGQTDIYEQVTTTNTYPEYDTAAAPAF